jgi:Fe-S-cluster-containing hydrogenase component 2
MACMNGYPRSATARAGSNGCTVLEIQRNVLDVIRRSRSYREELDLIYRVRQVVTLLKSVPLLAELSDAMIDELSKKVLYRRCEPGEVILRQGARAVSGRDPLSEGMFLVRSGFVRITVERPQDEPLTNYLGPGNFFGEVGLLSGLPLESLVPVGSPADPQLVRIRNLVQSGVRTATCSAIDHVELVQISPNDFAAIVSAMPVATRAKLASEALRRVQESYAEVKAAPTEKPSPAAFAERAERQALMREFLDQGLMGAQSVLVLDLLKCTRCDECAKACTDTHGGVTRLIREGLRFDRFLVASSCRSCCDPVCLVGCPVDAIHRRPGSNEIRIEETCIGCGRCAENCPYGNINMVPIGGSGGEAGGQSRVAVARKATTCDQCHSLPGHAPNCVVACPHDAAHRMKGPALFELVTEATKF